jgi:hypothetical protein
MTVAGCTIHGHAIVSDEDCIGDAEGRVPADLRNEADWARFQAALDRAAVTVLGRLGHAANPNPKRRNRLVLSSAIAGIERRRDAVWWNPAAASVEDALLEAAPGGGIAAVVGGRRVFDLFLAVGFDEFHLARAASVSLPHGNPVFSRISPRHGAEEILDAHGLAAGPAEWLDHAARVSLVAWKR